MRSCAGQRRQFYNIRQKNARSRELASVENEKYEPISLTEIYTIAAANYYLLEQGSGMKMLTNAKVLQNDGMLDVEALERYVTEELGGTIGQKYAQAEANITFTEGEIVDTPENPTPDVGETENPKTGDRIDIVVFGLVAAVCCSFLVALKMPAKKEQ